MRAKTFFKKINRGLILGLVLLIGIVIYVSIDESNFKKEKPAIENMLAEYFEESGDLCVTPQSNQKAGAKLPADELKQKISDAQNKLLAYWTDIPSSANAGMFYFFDKTEMLSQTEEMIKTNNNGDSFISKWSGKLEDSTTVQKNGPNAAIATVSFTVVAEYVGSPIISKYGSGIMTGDRYYGAEPSKDSLEKRQTVSGQAEVELIRVGGEWKITNINDYGYSMQMPETIG